METMEIAVTTDVGRVRELNEDTVLAEVPATPNPLNLTAVLMVADGVGGHRAGEVASKLCGDAVRRIYLETSNTNNLLPNMNGYALLTQMKCSLQSINEIVYAEEKGHGIARPASTLTLCLMRSKEYYIAHVGDSRAYLLRSEGIVQLTEDDSLVAEMVRCGRMTSQEAAVSQFRNQITKSIGTEMEVKPSLYQGSLEDGNVILLCSDGLTEYVHPSEIHEIVYRNADLDLSLRELVRIANDRGGHDNISIAAAKSGQKKADRKPATWPPVLPPNKSVSLMHNVASKNVTRPYRLALALILVIIFFIYGIWYAHHLDSTPVINTRQINRQNVIPAKMASLLITIDGHRNTLVLSSIGYKIKPARGSKRVFFRGNDLIYKFMNNSIKAKHLLRSRAQLLCITTENQNIFLNNNKENIWAANHLDIRKTYRLFYKSNNDSESERLVSFTFYRIKG